jgi:hypothetical protein
MLGIWSCTEDSSDRLAHPPLIIVRSGAPELFAMGIKGGASWERSDQFLRVRVLRRAKDLRRRTTFYDFASVQNRDAMTERGNR